MKFSPQDIEQIKARGIRPDETEKQIAILAGAVPFINVKHPATVGGGILRFSQENLKPYLNLHAEASLEGRLLKFVPASGAATRMFADLIAFYRELSETTGLRGPSKRVLSQTAKQAQSILKCMKELPFYDDLKLVMLRQGKAIDELSAAEKYSEILEFLLTEKGLRYSTIPKAIMKFHRYKDRARTALEEHLLEAKVYVEDRNKIARLHLTVSPEHRSEIEKCAIEFNRSFGEELGAKFEIGFSEQKPSSETIALDMNNELFKDSGGRLIFRPGGHGALLENLNDLKADIVFIKNIDNVCCDRYKYETILYKKVLCGYLIALEKQVFAFLERLERGGFGDSFIEQVIWFMREKLSVEMSEEFFKQNTGEKACLLFAKLNKPIRVCGMVKNEGEPGGAPYWVEETNGEVSLQIVETSQIDPGSKDQQAKISSSTHFNPVDLVCSVRDFKGKPFNLLDFRDSRAVFVSTKTKDGQTFKQLELPGLWNGGMAKWNTAFVEVPISTFNPAKTVADLLRKPHQCSL